MLMSDDNRRRLMPRMTTPEEVNYWSLNMQLELIREEWRAYKEFLREKYPAQNDEEWRLKCPHHIKLDELIGG